MDFLFKNRMTRTKDVFKEAYKYWFFQRKLMVMLNAFMIIYFLYGIYLAVEYKDYILLIMVFFIAFQIFRYFIFVNIAVKRDKEISDKEVECEVVVTNDFVQSTNSMGSFVRYEFCKIKKAVQTKNLIILFTKTNVMVIFRKDSFEIGTKEELVSFLKTKGIVVKGK